MDNPTVLHHESGRVIVTGGRFSKNSPNATLYKCSEKAGALVWRDNLALSFTEGEKRALVEKLKGRNDYDGVAQHLAGSGTVE